MKTSQEIAVSALFETVTEQTGIKLSTKGSTTLVEEGLQKHGWKTFDIKITNKKGDVRIDALVLVSLQQNSSCAVAVCLRGYRAPKSKELSHPNHWDHRHIST